MMVVIGMMLVMIIMITVSNFIAVKRRKSLLMMSRVGAGQLDHFYKVMRLIEKSTDCNHDIDDNGIKIPWKVVVVEHHHHHQWFDGLSETICLRWYFPLFVFSLMFMYY